MKNGELGPWRGLEQDLIGREKKGRGRREKRKMESGVGESG